LSLYTGNCASGPPVNALLLLSGEADVLVLESRQLLGSGRRGLEPGVRCGELLAGQVGELVDGEAVLLVTVGVGPVDELRVGLEHLEAPSLLGVVLVLSPVLGHPLLVPRLHRCLLAGQLTGGEHAGCYAH
jgi:hypothetical protein